MIITASAFSSHIADITNSRPQGRNADRIRQGTSVRTRKSQNTIRKGRAAHYSDQTIYKKQCKQGKCKRINLSKQKLFTLHRCRQNPGKSTAFQFACNERCRHRDTEYKWYQCKDILPEIASQNTTLKTVRNCLAQVLSELRTAARKIKGSTPAFPSGAYVPNSRNR